MDPSTAIKHHHHLTMCVGTAQEDYDFHTKLLGLKSVKKTALYDGTVPIYHLYYANDLGDESTILTSFPMRHCLRKAHFMGNAQHGHALFGKLDHGIEHLLDHLGIQGRGRLVKKHDLGPHA